MAVDIALHPYARSIFGNMPPLPGLPALAGQVALADDTDSDAIVVPMPGGQLVLVSTAKARVDIRLEADAALLDADTSGIVLGAEERVTFALAPGRYVLKTGAFA